MFFTWVGPIAGHVLYQWVKSLMLIICMIGIFIGTPFVVLRIYEIWGIDRFSSVINIWPCLYIGSFVGAVLVIERQGYLLYKDRVDLDRTNVDELIQPLLDKAGLEMPHIVFVDESVGIAAASQSLRFGGKLLFCREKLQELTSRQFLGVAAHEIAHLKHRDLYVTWLQFAMGRGLKFHRTVLYAFLITTFVWGTWTEFRFFATAWTCVFIAEMIFGLVARAYTRAREYLADAGGVALIGWNRRQDLIDALRALSTGDRRVPKQLEWLFTHPVTENRAAALKLSPDERRIFARAFA